MWNLKCEQDTVEIVNSSYLGKWMERGAFIGSSIREMHHKGI